MTLSTLRYALGTALFLCTFLAYGQSYGSGSAMLSGQQQVLPVATEARGTVDVQFSDVDDDDDDEDNDQVQVTVSGSFSGLSSPVLTSLQGGGHIHIAYPGRNGDIIQPLVLTLAADSLSGTIDAEDNTYTIAAADLEDADVGAVYVNIHTRNHPGGEIRGDIVREDREAYYTNLFGSNQVPSVISTAHGALLLELEDDNTLVVSGSFSDLTSTYAASIGSHLHLGLPGQNGPIDIALTPTITEDDSLSGIFRSEDNTIELDDDQVEALRAGRYYANIHSVEHPSGEIRGQVLPPADAILRAHLSGANEYPPVLTQAHGEVLGHVVGNTVRLIGSFFDLSSPRDTSVRGGTHLHAGYAGENGGIIKVVSATRLTVLDSLNGTVQLADNVIQLSDQERGLLLARGIYFNLHTTNHPMGEIRGQMLPESQAVFTAFLHGNQQIPSVITTGHGMVKVELMGTTMTATGSYTGLQSDLNTAIQGGAHLHPGYPGQSNSILYPLVVAADSAAARTGRFFPKANTISIPETQIDTLTDRFLYVNVHSLDHPMGEIRGQVLAEATSYFIAPLSGASQPEGVPTSATGMVATEVRDTMITLIGSFKDLDSDFDESRDQGGMHIHQAIAGSNGPILYPIATELDSTDRSGVVLADSNVIALEPIQLRALLDRELYYNVHTEDHPAGAIRGQALPLAQTFLHTTFSGANNTDYFNTTAQGGLKLELSDTMLMLSGSVTMLQGDFDYSVSGGAHLHLAPAGQNGDIIIPLSADTLNASKAAEFSVDSNTFNITMDQAMALRNGRMYANIHTTLVPSGEARGQIRGELNLPPDSTSILSPMDGDSLTLEGSNQQAFRVSYAPTTDPDGDTVIYVWQLAMDENFDSILFGANTGRDTFFETNFGTIATLLDSAGLAMDTNMTFYHRVLASDGSNYRPSEAVAISLNVGDIVGTRDFLPAGFGVKTYPNPLREGQAFTYQITTREAFRGRLMVFTQLGQLQQDINVTALVGEQNVGVDMSSLPAGTYFLMLRNSDGRLISTSRVVVQ
ncbi:CHRD domain-containing protein [Neolewinella sp.]|uniref:CHRD domain-containing protein n=1 Tax=Neolewinella sp. TaxID=2993543 RepID=UPI003B519EAE